jgi:hypothetical protein
VDTVITLNPMGELAIGLPLVFPRPGQTSPEEFWASILPRSFRALEILVAPRGETELRGLPMTPEDRPVTLSPNSFLLNGLVMVTLDAINAKMPVAQPVT